MNKSHNEISALMELQPEHALRITKGDEELIPIGELAVGQSNSRQSWERTSADGTIVGAETTVDEAAITGNQSLQRKMWGSHFYRNSKFNRNVNGQSNKAE